MTGTAEMIVNFLFLPVTLFILVPLLMLCGWVACKMLVHLKSRREMAKQHDQLDNIVILTDKR